MRRIFRTQPFAILTLVALLGGGGSRLADAVLYHGLAQLAVSPHDQLHAPEAPLGHGERCLLANHFAGAAVPSAPATPAVGVAPADTVTFALASQLRSAPQAWVGLARAPPSLLS